MPGSLVWPNLWTLEATNCWFSQELDQCYNTAQTIFEQDLQLKREAAQTQNATYLSATAMLCVPWSWEGSNPVI